VQLATGAIRGIGGDSRNCGARAKHCKFVHNKMTTGYTILSIVRDAYGMLARSEA
jgi:hypothetical protein